MPQLRFKVGDHVECCVDSGWSDGEVIALEFREDHWPLEKPTAPYQVKLDIGPEIYVPEDLDIYVRAGEPPRVKRFKIGDRVEARTGDGWSAGEVVATGYREDAWDPMKPTAHYQMKLDNGKLIYGYETYVRRAAGFYRFEVGDRVECCVDSDGADNGWAVGEVVKLDYREDEWGPTKPNSPYQVQLDDGPRIHAPYDKPTHIRRKLYSVGDRVECFIQEVWYRGSVESSDETTETYKVKLDSGPVCKAKHSLEKGGSREGQYWPIRLRDEKWPCYVQGNETENQDQKHNQDTASTTTITAELPGPEANASARTDSTDIGPQITVTPMGDVLADSNLQTLPQADTTDDDVDNFSVAQVKRISTRETAVSLEVAVRKIASVVAAAVMATVDMGATLFATLPRNLEASMRAASGSDEIIDTFSFPDKMALVHIALKQVVSERKAGCAPFCGGMMFTVSVEGRAYIVVAIDQVGFRRTQEVMRKKALEALEEMTRGCT